MWNLNIILEYGPKCLAFYTGNLSTYLHSPCILLMLQAPKPKNGIFCFMIEEARETTALELPEKDNTYVLKVSAIISA